MRWKPLPCEPRAWLVLPAVLLGLGAVGVVPFASVHAQSSDAMVEASAVDLRPAWREGQSARFSFTNLRTSRSTLEVPNRTIEQSFEILSEGEVSWVVERVNADGSAECSMTLDWMTAQVTLPDGSTRNNDTRETRGDDTFMHGVLRAMAGKVLTVQVQPNGDVSAVEGLDAMRDAAEDPDAIPEALDFIETATELAVLSGVPAALEAGDDWRVEQAWNFGIVGLDVGTLEQSWAYTLDGVETIEGVPVAIVSGEARDLDLDPSKANEDRPEGMPPLKVRLANAEATSRVLFDLSRSEAVGRSNTLTTTLEMEIPLPNGDTLEREVVEMIESQTLRIEEGG